MFFVVVMAIPTVYEKFMVRQRHLVNHVEENATNLASADTLLYSKALIWEWGGATFDYHWLLIIIIAVIVS